MFVQNYDYRVFPYLVKRMKNYVIIAANVMNLFDKLFEKK